MAFLTKNERVLLLVDVSNIMFKALHVHRNLSKGGVFTGGIYGFMAQVSTAIRETEATQVVFCFDRKPYFRATEMSTEYKAGRERSAQTTDHLRQTEKAVEELTDQFTKWQFDGLEADDLIAYGVRRYYNRFDKIVVQTSDTDPYQLFLENDRKLGFWKNNKDGLFTYKDFKEKTGLKDGESWLYVDAITGGHNGLRKGIAGFGEKRAPELVAEHQDHLQHLGLIYPEVGYNLGLMKLPHPDISVYSGEIRLITACMGRKELMLLCSKYAIKVQPAWLESFTKVK